MTGTTEDAVDRPVWQANSDSKTCTKCNREFTVFHRRHHCRGCGKLVCQQCSESRIQLPSTFNYGTTPQRVCSDCHTYMLNLQYEAKRQSGEVKPPDYPSLRTELLRRTLEYIKLPESGWHVTHNGGGVVTAVQPVPNSPFVCVRNQITVKAPPAKVQNVYADMNLWQQWNPHVKSKILEEVDGTARVLTARSELPLIDPRDTVFLTTRWEGVLNQKTGAAEERAGHFTTAAMSIVHPAYPPTPSKTVRAEMAISITQIEPMQNGEWTKFVSTVHMDPRGLLPPFLVNTLLGRGADHLRGMAKYVETH